MHVDAKRVEIDTSALREQLKVLKLILLCACAILEQKLVNAQSSASFVPEKVEVSN